MHASVIINNAAAKKIRLGELWLKESDVVGRKPALPQIVNLLDKKRLFIAQAFLSPSSRYYLRVFSKTNGTADRDFWRERMLRAYKRRSKLEVITNSFRVMHAEADGIPSVTIDRYNDIWTIQIGSSGAETIKKDLIDIIVEEFGPASIIEKNDSDMRRSEGLATKDVLSFGTKKITTVRELDQNFELDVAAGQKTGAYLDYRGFRLKARELAKGECLDAFSYQGWFSCHIAAKAKHVTAVEKSSSSIDAAKKNAKLNGHKNIDFIRADVFDYLKSCERRFDLIHLDPPSLAKGAAQRPAALSGYKKLITSSLKLLNAPGILFISSCSHAITEGLLEKIITECIDGAGLKCEFIYRGIQDSDHPLMKNFPESLYLKAMAVRVFN